MSGFGDEIVGRTFKKGSTVFMVMRAEPYPRDKISSQYKHLLNLPPGKLVAVSYRGTLIPNITVCGGVVRLTFVAVAGLCLSTPKAISEALGIRHPNYPYALRRVG